MATDGSEVHWRVTLRGSYTEAFHAPTLSELTPASSQSFPIVADPFSSQPSHRSRSEYWVIPICIQKWRMSGLMELFTARNGSRV